MTLSRYFQTHSMTEFAGALGVSVSLISMWTSRKRRVPVSRCLEIQRLTGGILRCELLRKDINWRR